MSEKQSVADVLNRAADLIEPEGAWLQGAFAKDTLGNEYEGYFESGDIRDFGGACFCVFGALAIAEDVKDPELARLGTSPLCKLLDLEYTGLISAWNDAPERTQAEVVAMLRKAAAIAKATHQ